MLTALLDRQVMAERHGSAPPSVLALHGWGRSSADWRDVMSGLDGWALDLPGFGASPEPDEAWTTARYAETLLPLVQESSPPVLVGHSFGGRVSVRIAANHPELVRGIVLTGAPVARLNGPTSKPALSFRIAKAMHRMGLFSEQRVEAARRKYGSDDYRNATPVLRGVLVNALHDDYVSDLEKIRDAKIPVHLVWGAEDTVVRVAVAQAVQEVIGTQARLDVVAGSGHLLDPELSAGIRRAVDSLLDVDAGGAR